MTVLLSITIPIGAMKHTYQLALGMPSTLSMRRTISLEQWQPWAVVVCMGGTMRTTTVHGCHCSSDMVLRMLKVLGIPIAELVGVLQC